MRSVFNMEALINLTYELETRNFFRYLGEMTKEIKEYRERTHSIHILVNHINQLMFVVFNINEKYRSYI